MQPDELDRDELVAHLAREATEAEAKAGELETWVAERLDGSIDDDLFEQACAHVAEPYLVSDPPQPGYWEHLAVALAFHSSRHRKHNGLGACKSVVRHLGELFNQERLGHFNVPELMTLAGGMTVVLAIQNKLTQDVENTVRSMCDRFPDAVADIADQCQDIWKRRGQMSGRRGLFLWDIRRQEWRLAQEFKPYRPSE